MKVRKDPIVTARVRRPPREGWSWIDRRFLKDEASHLDRDAVLLYFFLAAVSDRQGLSFWGDGAIGARLRLTVDQVTRAREALEARDLIAYRSPLYQVLSLPLSRRESPRGEDTGPTLIAEIFQALAERGRSSRGSEAQRRS